MVTAALPEDLHDLYPYQPNFLPLNSSTSDDNLNYHYLDEGKGETLLMLHGNPSWSFYYRNLVKGLKDKYRCVVPDHIGCGLSDKPQNYNYTLAQHIDNLEFFIDKLELKDITLVMHDWGGAIGMGYAVRHVKNIKRLVIFNTAAFLSGKIPFSINLCRLPFFGTVAIRHFNAFAGMAVIRACKNRDRMTNKVKRGYLAPYNNYANRIANLRFVQDIPMSPDIPSYPIVKYIEDHLDLLRDHPKLIIWGMKDFCFDDYYLARWKNIYPEADIHEMEDAGHYVVEDAYERIIPLMRNFII
ncbi:MAG: alpha/beta fold hydrolase [Nitrospinales bacterium]